MPGGGGRRPGRIRRRAARGRLLKLWSVTPNKPIKRHKGPFYWNTRDVSQFLYPPPIRAGFYVHIFFGWPAVSQFTYTHFSGCRHRRILPPQTGGRGFAFYLLNSTQTSRWPGFAFYLHTLSGRFLSKIEKNDLKFEKFSALRAAFFLRNP